MSTIDTETTNDGYTIAVETDEFADNPRTEHDNIACLTQLSDRHTSPGGQADQDESIVAAWDRYGWRVTGQRIRDHKLVERYARVCLGAVAVAWWDDPRSSSRLFGYLTAERAQAEQITDPQAYLHGEMSEYVAWLNGEVYGYTVTAPDGEMIESIAGFYGDDGREYMLSEARGVIKWHRDEQHAKRADLYRKLVNNK